MFESVKDPRPIQNTVWALLLWYVCKYIIARFVNFCNYSVEIGGDFFWQETSGLAA